MKKEILIDGIHEFDLIVEGKKHLLYFSRGEQWSSDTQGTLALGLKDTGNGFKIIGETLKRKSVGYDIAQYLFILLAAEKEYKVEMVEQKREL